MPTIRLDLDKETFEALNARALAQRRPVPLQAEVIIRQALNLQFPFPATQDNLSTPPEVLHD